MPASVMPYHPSELLLEWETRSNRPGDRPDCGDSVLERWAHADGADANLPELAAAPELMVVFTTYGRPAAAARVLSSLSAALEVAGLVQRAALLVLHDACGRDYTAARRAAADVAPTWLWLDARQRFGKPGFWRVHQTALSVARAWRPRLTLYLQDDVEFEPELLRRALALWQATGADPLRRVLYLFSSRDDEARGRWVRFARRDSEPCRLTNWFDLQAFLVDERFFDLLGHRMVPIHENRWKRQPELSSGVGRQFTLRLFGRAHIYQAWPPLVTHGAVPSTMNPEARAARSLDNRADYVASERPSVARA